MGQSVAEAERMSYWTFTALKAEWIRRNASEQEDEPVPAPSRERVRAAAAMAEAAGIAR